MRYSNRQQGVIDAKAFVGDLETELRDARAQMCDPNDTESTEYLREYIDCMARRVALSPFTR